MAYDINAFIDKMVHGSMEVRSQENSTFTKNQLTETEQKTLFKTVRQLLKNTAKEAPEYPHVLFLSGLMYQNAIGCEFQPDRAIRKFKHAIALNDAVAMNHQAMIHEWGVDGHTDWEAAVALYRKAIALNHTDAMVNLAGMYLKGKTGSVSYRLAAELYDKASDLGNIKATTHRGKMHLLGYGGPVDYRLAAQCFERAMAGGSGDALNLLAEMNEQGYLGGANFKAAAELYDRGIAQSNMTSVARRAELYKSGKGSIEDLVKYRILRIISVGKLCIYDKPVHGESNTAFDVLARQYYYDVCTDDLFDLAIGLHFLESLPANLPQVAQLKKNIFEAMEAKITPKFQVFQNFHSKVSGLGPFAILSLLFLLSRHARNAYSEEGCKAVVHALSFKTFAEDKSPFAQNTLKIISEVSLPAMFWLGMSYLNHERPGGFFSSSSRQQAIGCFQKAASMENPDASTRSQAQEKLHVMGVEFKTSEHTEAPSYACAEIMMMPEAQLMKVGF